MLLETNDLRAVWLFTSPQGIYTGARRL